MKMVLSLLVNNESGVASRISGLFTRRGFNIEDITGGVTSNPEISRITVVFEGDEDIKDQVINQLSKLEDVIKVIDIKNNRSVIRELVLIKVKANSSNRAAINEIVNIFRCKIIDLSPETLTIELTGDQNKISALITLMEDYGIEELVRTGITALERGDNTIDSYESSY